MTDLMQTILRWSNSIVFWSAWIIIPFIMEIIPAVSNLVILFRKRRRRDTAPDPVSWPEITLIIPVYNSGDSLNRCVRSIHESSYDDRRIRIFLVNNQTRDDSFAIYQKAQEEFPTLDMQWMNARQGKSRALNLALYNSTGKYIINIDSDGFLEHDALKNMVRMFESDLSIGSMTGTILTDPGQIEGYRRFFPRLLRKLEFVEYAQAFLAGRSVMSEHGKLYTLSGAFSAFRKSAILKSRMYNTNTIAEDTQITFQMVRLLHQKVKLCDDAIYYVGPIEGLDKLYTQRQRWQRGSLEVAKLFEDRNLMKPSRMFSDINVRTLMYDHTFAFPRVAWYLAMIALLFMGYSTRMILYSVLIITVIYIVISYLYYWEICIFLRKFPELRQYYRRQWPCVAMLPFFNMFVFFIRLFGILNSENTASSWKTRTLTEERADFRKAAGEEFSHVGNFFRGIRRFLNTSEGAAQDMTQGG